MKVIKFIFTFVIIYFIILSYSSMVSFARWISHGYSEIEYLTYIIFVILGIIYIIIPILSYYKRPSLKNLKGYLEDDKYTRKIQSYIYKILNDKEIKEYEECKVEERKRWIKTYLKNRVDNFDKIIKKYAHQITVTVMISPNSFIDGITILFSNSKMIYLLSKEIRFRYSGKELFDMYFSVFSAAAVTGLIEEYDEVIEDIIEDFAEEFSEIITEETGKSVTKSIPFMNIAINSISPILQAAGNYAFIVYSGNKFKYTILNIIEEDNISEKEIKKKSRKRARAQKYIYIKDMSSKIVAGTSKKIGDSVIKKFKSKKD